MPLLSDVVQRNQFSVLRPSQPSEVDESELLDFTNYDKYRQYIYDRSLGAVRKRFPISNDKYTLVATDLDYEGEPLTSLDGQKQAILQGKSLTRKIRGRLSLLDNATGQVLSTTGRKTVMNVPMLTHRGTYIRNGVEYSIPKQFRLMPSIYTRETDDGLVESQFNVKPGTGVNFRIFMEPETAVFNIRMGGRKTPLYHVLKYMGVSDDKLKETWGKDIWEANRAQRVSPHMNSWITSLALRGDRNLPPEEAEKEAAFQVTPTTTIRTLSPNRTREAFIDYFSRMEFNPDAVQKTLGTPYKNATPDAFLAATSKIIKVNRGEAESDDRDSLSFQSVHDIADFIEEKIAKDQDKILANQLWKITNKQGNLDGLGAGFLNKHIDYVFNKAGLAQPVEEINPLDMLSQNTRVIRLGEGAIENIESAPKESRNVQPSYLGFVDPIRSPECYSEDMDVMTEAGWKAWPTVTEEDKFACLIDGTLEFHKAEKLQTYDYNGELCGAETATLSYLVTPNHRMWCRPIPHKSKKYWPEFKFEFAADITTKNRIHNCSDYVAWESEKPVNSFTVPTIEKLSNNTHNVTEAIPMKYWARFMGWFLAEGSATYRSEKFSFTVCISQSKSVNGENYEEIRDLLSKLPFRCNEMFGEKGFALGTKQLTGYLKQFGKCSEKFIPDYIFNSTLQARLAFLDAFAKGDGRRNKQGVRNQLCTTSKQLAIDLQRLLFTVGKSSTITVEQDNRKDTYHDVYIVQIHTRPHRTVYVKNHRHPEGQYFTEQYQGKVYCATVPGGLLYVRRHQRGGFWCGNSLNVGLDMYFARGTRKGKDNLLYKQFLNPYTNKQQWVSSVKAADSVIGFPEGLKSTDAYVPALYKSKGMYYVPREEVDYFLESGDDMFNYISDTVPLKSGVKGMRLLMGCLSSDTEIEIRRADHTQIVLPVSKYVPAIGDSIQSIDEENNTAIFRLIRGVRVNDLPIARRKITLNSGKYLVTTLNHTWVVFNSADELSKITALDLKKGMEVPVSSGLNSPCVTSSIVKEHIVDIEELAPEQYTYDLDVDDSTFMCANGIFVHNSKFITQALPLLEREAPLVQTQGRSGKGVFEEYGKDMGAQFAKGDGKVVAVYKDHLKLQYNDGTIENVQLYDNYISSDNSGADLYDEFPLARKTSLHNTPVVKAGFTFKKGDLLASSNFTDDKGVAAPGKNLRVAYMNYKGKNFEDAMSISESAAQKLTSEMMYKNEFDLGEGISTDKNKFHALFPTKFSKDKLETIDDTGMVKQGTVLNYGDPIFVGVKEKIPSLATLGRRTLSDQSVTWQHHAPGVVMYADRNKDGLIVYTKSFAPMEVGDKLAIPFGGKGVISHIIPDDQMPRDAKGNIIDVLISPLSVLSRTNSAQLIAAQLGKVAAKTGKPYVLPGFIDEDLIEFAENELRKNNLTDTENVYDPSEDRTLKDIFVGNIYGYKLQQTAESKGKARSVSAYSSDETPSKGGAEGAKHIGQMELEAFLSHGAFENLKDIKLIKAQKNDTFWRDLKLGKTPTIPGTPFVYEKFKSLLQSAGINLREENDADHIFAMTNEQVKKLTGTRELQNSKTFSANELKPIPGGLFDPELTGSLSGGDRTAYIKLPEPMLNPVMEGPIKSILGLTQKELDAIIQGTTEYKGKMGGAALLNMLNDVNLNKVKENAREEIKSGSKAKRDAAIKRYRFASSMLENDTKPADFMMERVLVLPPKFRPISKQGDLTMVNDMNHMYKSLMESVADFDDAKELPKEMQDQARLNVYNNYKAVVGLADPTQSKLVQKNIGGIFKQLFGSGSAKNSFVQRRVIGGDIDMSGLAVITPNPALKLNEVGLPENKAWDLYEPFIVRHLVMGGVPATTAAKAVESKDKMAYTALQEVIKQRPVLINRAPTLHKYSIIAMWPVLTKGKTLQIPPGIIKPFGADHDGNCADFDSSIRVKISKSDLHRFISDAKVLIAVRNDLDSVSKKEAL